MARPRSPYSTLAVRLGHSGLFTTGRAEMWRNAAVFTAKAGGKCGLFLHEFAAGETAEYAKYAEWELRGQRHPSWPLSELLRQSVLLSRGSRSPR